MRGVNKVILIGNLGNDPETRRFDNGGSVTNFSVATSESWIDKNTGERREQTEWHRVTLNNRLGEIAQQYLRKGSKVYIEGSLRTRRWTDQNGQERFSTEIMGNQMQMLDSRPQDGNWQPNNTFDAPRFNNPQNGYGQSSFPQGQGGYPQQGGTYPQATPGGYGQSQQPPYSPPPASQPNPAPSSAGSNTTANEPDDDLPF